MMGKYWKADVLRKLIKIEEENGENVTITMSYLTYLKKMLHFASSEDSEIKTFDDIDISKVESIETSEEDLKFEKQFKGLSPAKRERAIKFLEKGIGAK